MLLGRYTFTGDGSEYVEMSDAAGPAAADAIRLVKSVTDTAPTYEVWLYSVHNDHLGTPQAMSDQSGALIWRTLYAPFGQASVDEDPDGDGTVVGLNIVFPGQYFDKESGLHYNYYRDYDPETGRYLQSDPIGLAGGVNTYGYAYQNPLMYTDPLGLEPWDFDGQGDTSVCSYYDQMASQTGCDYYKDAAQICRGNNDIVNAAITAGIIQAWMSGNTTASESEILTSIREGLVSNDQISSSLNNNAGVSPPRGDFIDLYHNLVFSNAGISTWFYGGNLWPQGIWPNVVPYDPIGNSILDPRRYLLGAGDDCDCQN